MNIGINIDGDMFTAAYTLRDGRVRYINNPNGIPDFSITKAGIKNFVNTIQSDFGISDEFGNVEEKDITVYLGVPEGYTKSNVDEVVRMFRKMGISVVGASGISELIAMAYTAELACDESILIVNHGKRELSIAGVLLDYIVPTVNKECFKCMEDSREYFTELGTDNIKKSLKEYILNKIELSELENLNLLSREEEKMLEIVNKELDERYCDLFMGGELYIQIDNESNKEVQISNKDYVKEVLGKVVAAKTVARKISTKIYTYNISKILIVGHLPAEEYIEEIKKSVTDRIEIIQTVSKDVAVCGAALCNNNIKIPSINKSLSSVRINIAKDSKEIDIINSDEEIEVPFQTGVEMTVKHINNGFDIVVYEDAQTGERRKLMGTYRIEPDFMKRKMTSEHKYEIELSEDDAGVFLKVIEDGERKKKHRVII